MYVQVVSRFGVYPDLVDFRILVDKMLMKELGHINFYCFELCTNGGGVMGYPATLLLSKAARDLRQYGT